MAHTYFLFVCFVSVCVLLNTVNAQTSVCCCSNGYELNVPPSVTDECLYQHDYFTDQWSHDYNGYASYTDACGGCCPGGSVYCNPASGFWIEFFTDRYRVTAASTGIFPGCGNTVTIVRTWAGCINLSQTITIQDTIPPEVFVPPDRDVECVSTNGAAGPEFNFNELDNYFGSARATDLCTNAILTEGTQNVVADSCIYQITRTFVANDGCNNSPTQFQNVRFVDTTDPVIYSTIGSVLTFTCDQTASFAAANVRPSATDSCDNLNGAVPSVVSEVVYQGRCTGEYSIERTWGITDRCGNQGFYVQTIIVEDPDPPLVSRNGGAYGVPVNHYEESLCYTPNPATYVARDACGGATYISMEETTTGVNELESHFDVIRTYRATDDCGNYVEWQDVVNVNEGTAELILQNQPEITATRGSNIVIFYAVSEASCVDTYVVFDIGAAEFVSISLVSCTNGNGGLIYCAISGPTSGVITLTIVVPTTYAPDTLEVRQTLASTDPFEHFSFNAYSRTIIKLT